jgi:hypothetical protein
MNLQTFRWTALAAAALTVPLMAPVGLAQSQRICIVDESSNRVYCGRAATAREISNGGYDRNGNRTSTNGRDIYRDRDSRYETRETSSRRDWSDLYDDLEKIYQEVLGRSLDQDGLRTYLRRLDQGWSLVRIREDIANSSEARNALDAVYRRTLGRGVDPDGFRTYSRKIARGDSLGDVERELRKSDEARRR